MWLLAQKGHSCRGGKLFERLLRGAISGPGARSKRVQAQDPGPQHFHNYLEFLGRGGLYNVVISFLFLQIVGSDFNSRRDAKVVELVRPALDLCFCGVLRLGCCLVVGSRRRGANGCGFQTRPLTKPWRQGLAGHRGRGRDNCLKRMVMQEIRRTRLGKAALWVGTVAICWGQACCQPPGLGADLIAWISGRLV